MPFQFEPNLPHQKAAVEAVTRVFKGALYTYNIDPFWIRDVFSTARLDVQKIRENVAVLAKEQGMEGDYGQTDEMDFSVEMETGTGKTYVYLRTIFELHKQYGLCKFMIVVPSVAVREGVLAALRDTRVHFEEIYREKASVVAYSSKRLHEVRHFCETNHLFILVMNKQAFDGANNVINDEKRDSGNLLEQLQKARPVIVMDEPQEGMDTENMQARLAAFNPLFKLRYSATHRCTKNLVHRLTPYDAYNSGLVKKVSVLSICEAGTESQVEIKFSRVNLGKGRPTATLILNVRRPSGEVQAKKVTVKMGDNLAKKTNNPIYAGWIVEDVGSLVQFGIPGYVKFINGKKIEEGGALGGNKEEIFRQQIRYSIEQHFARKAKLAPMGIKPIALFFIDRVANYVEQNGLIRRLFVEEYERFYRESKAHKKLCRPPSAIAEVHGGYFAETSKGEHTDSARSMAGEASKEVYDRILRKKAELLSFDEPLEFIFSHSALGVGWDNPNVFTICTLNESVSKIKKRQEIGRGLRLCVRQDGKRHRDPEGTPEEKKVNHLIVVANESYRTFVSTYQDELRHEMGENVRLPDVENIRSKPAVIKRHQDRFDSKEFSALWKRISQQTRYEFHFSEKALIKQGKDALSGIFIQQPELRVTLTEWEKMSRTGIDGKGMGDANISIEGGRYAPMDVVDEFCRGSGMASKTVCAILEQLPYKQLEMLAMNPVKFIAEAAPKLKRIADEEMVRGIRYEKTGDVMPRDEMFLPEQETKRELTPTPNRGLYDHIIHDSDVERNMAIEFDKSAKVRLLFKLPDMYQIPTPIGNYTPDFALMVESQKLDGDRRKIKFYFVVETKGTSDMHGLRLDERMKIQCAIRHFEALGMEGYLAPVKDTASFDNLARARTGATLFD